MILKKFENYILAKDERGSLFALNKIENFNAKRIYLIEPKKGHWRGKHYHKLCTQLIAVMCGTIECKIIDENLKEKKDLIRMNAGDVYIQKPGITFSFSSIEENTKIVILSDHEFDSSDYYETFFV